MHTHGTAVLDRPAEAAAPVSTPLPAPATSASTPDPVSARSTTTAKELTTESEVVLDLGYTELAVALNASGICPDLFRSAAIAQLIEWAAQGLALLGIDRVRHFAQFTRQLHPRPFPSLSTWELAKYDRIWPSLSAVQPCHDAAYRITYTLHPSVSQITRPASPDHPCPSHPAPCAPLAVPLSRSGL